MLELIAACLLAQPEPAASPPPERVAWIRAQSIPFDTCEAGNGFGDLQPLKQLIGDARIVALGEGTHGTREFFQMKHRLMEFLAVEMGFTVFAIEASMPEAFAVDGYVSKGEGDPEKLIRGMYFWTWSTDEVADMVRWMRAFNEAGKGPIRFTGFDMQTPDVAMRIVLDLLKEADPAYAKDAANNYATIKKTTDGGGRAFGVATGSFPVQAAAGHRVVYSGWIKTQGVVDGFAGLWWRADGADGPLGFDNMEGRGPKGDTDWKRYTIEMEVPAGTKNINFGMIMPGRGQAWFDDLAVEIDGKPWMGDGFDFTFESEAIKGFIYPAGGSAYTTRLDGAEAHGGKQSLRLASGREAAAASSGPPPKVAAQMAAAVVTHLEREREAYLRAAGAERVDWAIQNARVVEQWARMKGGDGGLVRDQSMAENVSWILDHSPPGTKIVLWAHNGHIARHAPWMGSHLAKKYGREMVVLGFAASSGRYTAMGEGGLGGHDLAAAPEGSLEWHLETTGLPRLILPLRAVSPADPGSAWLAEPVAMRSIGALAQAQQFFPDVLPPLYDGVIYIRHTTEARQLGR